MLIAISTFVRESFNTNTATSGDNLDSIRVGELSVEIENGPTAQLVAIVRGSAEKQLRPLMQTALARMYEEQPGVMELYHEPELCEPLKPYLESCLISQYRDG